MKARLLKRLRRKYHIVYHSKGVWVILAKNRSYIAASDRHLYTALRGLLFRNDKAAYYACCLGWWTKEEKNAEIRERIAEARLTSELIKK